MRNVGSDFRLTNSSGVLPQILGGGYGPVEPQIGGWKRGVVMVTTEADCQTYNPNKQARPIRTWPNPTPEPIKPRPRVLTPQAAKHAGPDREHVLPSQTIHYSILASLLSRPSIKTLA